MVWPFGSSSNNAAATSSASSDPLANLDPSLRAFLEKEAPVKYRPAQPSPPQSNPQTATAAEPSSDSTTSPHDPEKPQPPTAFPDGRYAHLWSTYTPLSTIESASKSSQEKLADILQSYSSRKALLGAAALENCALEQGAINDCFRNGPLKSRMTLCREENRSLERCYVMQSRFLKALGYMNVAGTGAGSGEGGEAERVQMHADRLYQRMLEQEKRAEEAKAKGEPMPDFKPILEEVGNRGGELPKLARELSPAAQKDIRERLKDLSPLERELEEKALAMEIQSGEETGKAVDRIFREKQRERDKRREDGKETASDRIAGWFGW
jgi:hypothetical protein